MGAMKGLSPWPEGTVYGRHIGIFSRKVKRANAAAADFTPCRSLAGG
jgi:hypothetical protein